MSTTETVAVHVALARALAELPSVGKTQRNAQQGYNFRGIEDIVNAVNPVLGRHGLVILPDVLERIGEERTTKSGGAWYTVHVHVRYTLVGPAGDTLTCSAWGEGVDNGDKATNKAMTTAFKNMLTQVFAISTKDISDGETQQPPQTEGGQRAQAQSGGDPNLATDKQLKMLGVTASKIGVKDSAAARARIADQFDIHVESLKLLTKRQASQIIEAWKAEETAASTVDDDLGGLEL